MSGKTPEFKEYKTELIRVEEVYPNEWNPNVQQDAVFNALVSNIQEIGFVEAIMVADKPSEEDPSKRYMIISGEHRWEACKVLGFEEIPAVIRNDFDEDMEKFMTVRMNILKGDLDTIKFTKLFDQLAKKYSEEVVKDMMAFVDENKFQQVYKDIKRGLPPKMRKQLEDTRSEIQNVDDLSKVLNHLFSTYGDTLSQNFMVFTYGGKVHLWVLMSDALKKKMIEEITVTMSSRNLDMSVFIEKLVDKYGDTVQEEMISEGVGVITETAEEFDLLDEEKPEDDEPEF